MFLVFPSLLTFSFFAPTVLRVISASIFLREGYRMTKSAQSVSPKSSVMLWYLAIIEITVGVSFLVGFWTQLGAILGIFLTLKLIYFKKKGRDTWARESIPTYLLLLGICVSLLVTGAGAFAFDLPL